MGLLELEGSLRHETFTPVPVESVACLVEPWTLAVSRLMLGILQDRLYWTDVEDEAIYSANRLTGHDVAKVAEHLNNPLDLVVFHEQRQPKGESSRHPQQGLFLLPLQLAWPQGRTCSSRASLLSIPANATAEQRLRSLGDIRSFKRAETRTSLRRPSYR